MTVSPTISKFLASSNAKFTVIPHEKTTTLEETAEVAHIPYAKMLRAVILTDDENYFMAVLPVTHVLDFHAIQKVLGRDIKVAKYQTFSKRFDCCQYGCIPPLGAPFNMGMLIDNSVRDMEEVYIEPGSHTDVLKFRTNDFLALLERGHFGHYANALTTLTEDTNVSNMRYASSTDIKRRIEAIYDLPAMPDMAMRILELNRDPEAMPADLSAIVQMDPSLAAQTLRYANSPLFGYKGNINSVQDAIVRVLGFDMVMNLALGIAIGKSFKNPADGPLGLNAFWQHSVATATLAQRFARMMPSGNRPQPGMAYLTGLLHNFGFLLLGHLFQPEFYLLNKLAAANPDTPIVMLEQRVMGLGRAREAVDMGHEQMGAWLMEAWGLPAPVTVSVGHHHNAEYDGEHAVYVQLIQLSNILLKRIDIGDASETEIPAELLASLGLEEAFVVAAFEEIIESKLDEVSAMAEQMAA